MRVVFQGRGVYPSYTLPDDSTVEDIQYHLYVLEKIRRGRDDIKNGRSLTQAQAKERLQKWLKP